MTWWQATLEILGTIGAMYCAYWVGHGVGLEEGWERALATVRRELERARATRSRGGDQ